jgi:hypothetical protein
MRTQPRNALTTVLFILIFVSWLAARWTLGVGLESGFGAGPSSLSDQNVDSATAALNIVTVLLVWAVLHFVKKEKVNWWVGVGIILLIALLAFL